MISAYKIIDRQSWHRKDHHQFYSQFSSPCFNLCVPVAAQNIYECAKDNDVSFFQLALYGILRAANLVPQLKQRMSGDDIIEFANIKVMTPILTTTDGFRQIWCENALSFADFTTEVTRNIETAKTAEPAPMKAEAEDYFCASCLPWVHFSSITHAEFNASSAVPTLTWGKLKNGVIPVAGKFNHAFVDGIHAGRFFAYLEEVFADPSSLWQPECRNSD